MKKPEKELKEPLPKDIDRMLDWMGHHPLAQKIIEEKRGEIRKRRRIVIEEVKRLEREYEPKRRDLIAKVEKAEADWKEAQENLSKANLSLGRANWNLRDETSTFQTKIGVQKNILHETTSPLIDDFTTDMQIMLERIRHDVREGMYDWAKTNIGTLKKTYTFRSNLRAVEFCMAYIKDVIKKAQDLRYSDQPENLEEILDGWKSNIPSIEKMEEFKSELPR